LPASKEFIVAFLLKDEENIIYFFNNGDILCDLVAKKDLRAWDEKVRNKQSQWNTL